MSAESGGFGVKMWMTLIPLARCFEAVWNFWRGVLEVSSFSFRYLTNAYTDNPLTILKIWLVWSSAVIIVPGLLHSFWQKLLWLH
jgi:hypothetical protein